MDLSKVSEVCSIAVVMVFAIAIIGGCGQQDSATADQSEPEQAAEHEDLDNGHDDHSEHEEGHDDDHEEPGEHYEGEKAESWEQAVANLKENNQKLSQLLEKDKLSEYQLEQVHKLTYTLENALGRIQQELDQSAKHLEEVHLGSEERNADRVRSNAEKYLETSNRLTD